MMKHLMIDLETLGTEPGSVITSIAAVEFDMTGVTGHCFNINIDIASSMKAKMTIDPKTLKWWLTQQPDIMARMFESPLSLEDALFEFSSFVKHSGCEEVWGNSASFDLGLLSAAYRAIDKPIPWKYWGERCYRTMLAVVPKAKGKPPEDAHDPIVDCMFQIENLVTAYGMIRKGIK
jgi:hypothetical protein